MVSIQASSGTRWVPSPRSASEAALTALIAPKPVAFDTGHLYQPFDRVAGHAQVMLQRDLSRVFDLRRSTAQHRRQIRRHPWRLKQTAYFGLTPASAPLIEALNLTSPPMAAAVSRKSSICASEAPGDVFEPIFDHRRHHTGRAVGGRGHDLTTGGVFLVHGHGVDAHPVVDLMRRSQVGAAFGNQRIADTLGDGA